jgi:hypothetical protein
MRSLRWLAIVAAAATVAVPTMLAPSEALAQRRAVRRPPVRVVRVPVRYYRPYYYYRPFYAFGGYAGWYHGYGWPSFYYGQWYPYPYGYGRYDYIGEARIQVEPREAEVFIDGYYVGRVDDFDGWAQRLRVEPGEHVLEIFHEGYRTYRQQVLFRPGATLKIEHVMEPLGAGESPGPRPAPAPRPASSAAPSRAPADARRPGRYAPPPPARTGEAAEYGAIAVRVQPADAEVIVDGEPWESPQAGDLTLQLSEGTHRVEVRKEGFRPYSADVTVRRGETTSLNVSLSR